MNDCKTALDAMHSLTDLVNLSFGTQAAFLVVLALMLYRNGGATELWLLFLGGVIVIALQVSESRAVQAQVAHDLSANVCRSTP